MCHLFYIVWRTYIIKAWYQKGCKGSSKSTSLIYFYELWTLDQFSTLVVTKSQVQSFMTFAFFYQKQIIGGWGKGRNIGPHDNRYKSKINSNLTHLLSIDTHISIFEQRKQFKVVLQVCFMPILQQSTLKTSIIRIDAEWLWN